MGVITGFFMARVGKVCFESFQSTATSKLKSVVLLRDEMWWGIIISLFLRKILIFSQACSRDEHQGSLDSAKF